MLLAPLAHAIAIEIGRLDVVGPTVDAIRLDNMYGVLALILGRGFHGFVGLLPMMLGVSLGVALGRHLSRAEALVSPSTGRLRSVVRWTPAAVGLVGLTALAVLIALPASTPPILGADGKPLPGSIAELTMVQLGGHDQAVMIRGHSVDNPVLLYLSGGPGQSDLPYVRVLLGDLEQDFVVVGWDQRGTGKSYAALDPTSTLTLDQAVSDTIELARYLRERFGEEKIYLTGESWGTTLGVLAVQRHPELFYAFIASGQMVSQRETDRRLYQDVRDLAERMGDTELMNKMLAYGQPPYVDIPYANVFVMGYYDALYKPYTPPQAYMERGMEAGLGPWGVLGSEYSLVEKVNVLRGLMDMFTVMYPQLQGIDFRRDVTRLDIPVYILDGEAELVSRRDLALEWLDSLDAPIKRLFSFENAGHSVSFEQFEAFHQIMVETVLPETYPGR
jgi:pimeloyl-ACP methyl ester carboxylesterase